MDQAKKLLGALTPRQLATIVIVAIAMVAGVLGFSRWERQSGLRPLYTGLAPEDANAIVQKLHEAGVDYKIANNGTELLVPEDKVPELRLEMAGLGLPKTGRIGFEIFDKTNFGITDFAEHVNYRRALEGELERSIMAISEVQQAQGSRDAAQGFRLHRRPGAGQGQCAGWSAPGDALVVAQRDRDHEPGIERGGRPRARSPYPWST